MTALWAQRLARMAPSVSQRSSILAVRRCILGICGLKAQVADNWFQLSQSLRQLGKYDSAVLAVRQAEAHGLQAELALLQECRIYRDSGDLNRALMLLEPVEVDTAGINTALRQFKQQSKRGGGGGGRERERGGSSSSPLPSFLDSEDKRHMLAERIQLATEVMVLSKQKQGSGIINRYRTVILLHKYWPQAYFDLARYYEFLYQDARSKQLQSLSELAAQIEGASNNINHHAIAAAAAAAAAASSTSGRKESNPVVQMQQQWLHQISQLEQDAVVANAHLEKAVEKYGNCLVVGVDSDLAMQTLPRMLTLWLQFTSPNLSETQVMHSIARSLQKVLANNMSDGANSSAAPAGGGRARASGGSSSAAAQASAASSAAITTALKVLNQMHHFLQETQERVNAAVRRVSDDVPAHIWFICITQLVSRVLHGNPGTVQVICSILSKILLVYPKQSIWHLSSIMFSMSSDRRQIATRLVQQTCKSLVAQQQQGRGSGAKEKEQGASDNARMMMDMQTLGANLINLSAHQCKERRIHWKFPADMIYSNFLVPTQAVLHCSNPFQLLQQLPIHSTGSSNSGSNSTAGNAQQMFISSISTQVDVAASKAKPKTISLRTVCGRTVKFLCKMEKDGDLRKDARMMEFNAVVNRLLQENPESGSKRGLRVRTYAVVCLNEESGLLEWVNNTNCLRALVAQAHSYWPDPRQYPAITYREIHQEFQDLQEKYSDDINTMLAAYTDLLQQHNYQPCFHRWFLEEFPDPTAWQAARNHFTRSAAVWSAVGHVVGLGDRHIENILMDVTNGECVHVDFDCLFDKGLGLGRPEIVPFRLTCSMVDAMGVSGVEGSYRRALEIVLGVLRDNRDALLSVLEPFLHDPTVAWSRSGRAQRNLLMAQSNAGGAGATSTSTVDGKSGVTTTVRQNNIAGETENKEAKEMLRKIGERLNGVYNLQHPHRDKFARAAVLRKEVIPARGIGAAKEEMLPVSVEGQAQRLIEEATAPENLMQMFVGWQPWI